MKFSFEEKLSYNFHQIQRTFFPDLEVEAGPIPPKIIELGYILMTIRSNHLPEIFCFTEGAWTGRPPKSRSAILNAFVAKAFLNLPDTKHLIERLHSDKHLRLTCGFQSRTDIPSESVFSRTFAEIAKRELPQKIHETLIRFVAKDRVALHLSRDSTTIETRERPAFIGMKAETSKSKEKKNCPKKREHYHQKLPSLIQKQRNQSLEQLLQELPRECNVGSKKNSQGYVETWRGYKLHIDTVEGDLPVAALLTSASVHDSIVAIPLMRLSRQRVRACYQLMDAAYDAKDIREYIAGWGQKSLIDENPRRDRNKAAEMRKENLAQQKIHFTMPQKIRFKSRTAAERVNARLKDEFGGCNIRVRGATKVMCHLMFGLLVLTVDQIHRMLF